MEVQGCGTVARTLGTWRLLEDFLSASVSSFEKWSSTAGGGLVKSNTPFFPLLKSICRAAPLWQARSPGWDLAHSCKRGCSHGRRVHPAQDSTPRMEMNQCSTRKVPNHHGQRRRASRAVLGTKRGSGGRETATEGTSPSVSQAGMVPS